MPDTFFVYILANTRSPRPVLYVGITNDLVLRVAQHRCEPTGFTGRYHVGKLVYFESTSDVRVAKARGGTSCFRREVPRRFAPRDDMGALRASG